MTILPWGVVLLLLPSRVWFLLKRNKKVAIGGLLPTIKTVSRRRCFRPYLLWFGKSLRCRSFLMNPHRDTRSNLASAC
jgi:hypothetical protein